MTARQNPPTRISPAGVDLLKRCEGFSDTPYRDVAGHFTIGYGHRIKPGERFTRITRQEAEALLREDAAVAESCLCRLVKHPLSQNQFDALVCFVYNVGAGAFENSTLLRLLNRGELQAASAQFERWVYAGGRKQAGLISRRLAENLMFSQDINKA